MALSVRTRFEVFKRDDFTCRYCGKKSPEVILEVDHIVPVCDGGSDDAINLATSCWDCNRGKAGVPLNSVMTGEDPHDRAIELLERERQLREYNAVLVEINQRKAYDVAELVRFWCEGAGWEDVHESVYHTLTVRLDEMPAERIKDAMRIAIANGKTKDLRYFWAVLRNLKQQE